MPYATETKESNGSLEYNLFLGKFENCKQCPVLPFGPKTDSELWGLSRLNSKCPSKKFVANSNFDNVLLSAVCMGDSIYYITPNNIKTYM